MSTILRRSETASGTAYASRGDGDVVVLIHGVGMRLEAWAPQIDALAPACRVVAVDMPGHGESRPLSSGPRLPDYVGWCIRFIEELGSGPVSLAGHSMGAMIAGGVVAEAPHLVRRVALLNGVYRREKQARDAVIARAAEIVTGHFDREAPLRRWFGPGHEHEAAFALCRQLLAEVDAEGYAAAYRAFAEGDGIYADRWAECRCPALFLTGAEDLNSTPAMARAMAGAAPHGRAVVIEGHRHMVNLTAPEAVNAALADWMSTVAPGEGGKR